MHQVNNLAAGLFTLWCSSGLSSLSIPSLIIMSLGAYGYGLSNTLPVHPLRPTVSLSAWALAAGPPSWVLREWMSLLLDWCEVNLKPTAGDGLLDCRGSLISCLLSYGDTFQRTDSSVVAPKISITSRTYVNKFFMWMGSNDQITAI